MKPPDIQGIFLRLQALAESVPAVGKALQLDTTPRRPETSAPPKLFAAIVQELENLYALRIYPISPANRAIAASTLGPGDFLTSRRKVIAALERAQIAALRRQVMPIEQI